MRILRVALIAALLLSCKDGPTASTPDVGVEDVGRPKPPPPRPKSPAVWPPNCLIENMGVHPIEPVIAAACTDSETGTGAVLIFDGERAALLRAVARFDEIAGWAGDKQLVRWSADGSLLATNVSTNGIAVLDAEADLLGRAFPDDTRDGGVAYTWVDGRIFADTGAFFSVTAGDPDQFDFRPSKSPHFMWVLHWNATIGAVVGRVERGLAAFDPVQERLLYEVNLGPSLRSDEVRCTSDGHWCSRTSTPTKHPRVEIYDATSGKLRWTVKPTAGQVVREVWSANHDLAIWGRRGAKDQIDVVHDGKIVSTLKLGDRIEASGGLDELSGLAWSPGGDALAVLTRGQHVELRDPARPRHKEGFDAAAPPPPEGLPAHYTPSAGGVLWPGPKLLARASPHFVSFWSADGTKLGELVVPTR